MTDSPLNIDDRVIATTTGTPNLSALDLLREDFVRRMSPVAPPLVTGEGPQITLANGAPAAPREWTQIAQGSGIRIAQGDGVQLAQGEPPVRTFTIRPTDLIPHQVLDIEATFNSQRDIRRALQNRSPSETAGIDPDIMSPEAIRNLATQINRVADRLAPGQPPLSLSAGLEPFAAYAARAFGDPTRQRTEVGVQLELFRRSLNQELQAMGSQVRFGPVQSAVDEGGRLFYALPVMHNGAHANMLRFPPMLSEREIEERRANRPRLV